MFLYIKEIVEGCWQKEQMFVLPDKFCAQNFIKNLSSLHPITTKSKHFPEYKIHKKKNTPYIRDSAYHN